MIRFEKANGYSEVIDPSKVKAVHRMVSCGSRPQSIIVLDQPNDNSVPVLGTVSEVKRKLRVPAAYRLLEVGEVIRKGDEYRWGHGCEWSPSSRAGISVQLCSLDYRRPISPPVKAQDNSVTISRRDAKKLFKLAKAHCKREIEDNEWRFGPDNDEQEWRTFLKALRKLEAETLNPK